MSAVCSFNDFNQLEEIVLGTARNYHLPPVDISLRHFFEPPPGHEDEQVSTGKLNRLVEETEEDMQTLTDALTGLGVIVRRPEAADHGRTISLLDWSTTATHALMPRDCLLVIGETIIEAPMPVRSRYTEIFPYRTLLREYFESGANWFAAPRPQLLADNYKFTSTGPVLAETEPLFDAANVIRLGSDVFFNVSNTGNRFGATWLSKVLGADFRVHEISICSDHIGTTLHVLRPGVLLANAGRLRPNDIPDQMRTWKCIWFDNPRDDGFGLSWPRASAWIGMNILSINEDTVIVPSAQEGLAHMLEKEGFTTIQVPYRHGRTFGGGFHCCTLDVRRQGSLESYL